MKFLSKEQILFLHKDLIQKFGDWNSCDAGFS